MIHKFKFKPAQKLSDEEAMENSIALKRIDQLEQEKDMLVHGMEMVERARQWYHTQIHRLYHRQYLNTPQQDCSLDFIQEKIDMQHAHISTLNQQLALLINSSNKGFPAMTVAPSTETAQKTSPSGGDEMNKKLQEQQILISRLKQQNQHLTKEVNQKSDNISRLERERVQIVREMFEMREKFQERAKTRHGRGNEESSFI